MSSVGEVEDISRIGAGMRAVEARERLHGLNTGEPPVNIHAAEQRLIKAGLELVGDKEELIVRAPKGFVTPAAACWVYVGAVAEGMKKISYAGYRFPPEVIH
jgi:hypothetical protein